MGGCCVGDCCIVDCGFCCVFDFSCSDCGNRSSYDDGSAKAADKINKELAELKERAESDTKKIVEKILHYVSQYIDNFWDSIEEINNDASLGFTLSLDIDSIKKENVKLKENVNNFITNRLNDRLVKTDPELSLIFKEKDEKERNKKFNAFYKRVFDAAKKDLISDIEKTVDKQVNMIVKELTVRSNEIQNNITKFINEIETIKQEKETNGNSYRANLKIMFDIDCGNILKDLIKD